MKEVCEHRNMSKQSFAFDIVASRLVEETSTIKSTRINAVHIHPLNGSMGDCLYEMDGCNESIN